MRLLFGIEPLGRLGLNGTGLLLRGVRRRPPAASAWPAARSGAQPEVDRAVRRGRRRTQRARRGAPGRQRRGPGGATSPGPRPAPRVPTQPWRDPRRVAPAACEALRRCAPGPGARVRVRLALRRRAPGPIRLAAGCACVRPRPAPVRDPRRGFAGRRSALARRRADRRRASARLRERLAAAAGQRREPAPRRACRLLDSAPTLRGPGRGRREVAGARRPLPDRLRR